jgi:CubicO group peptidase (beta-lactamase class C family)
MHRVLMNKLLSLLLLLLTPTIHAAGFGGQIDRFAQRAMHDIGTPPGLAVVVVQGDHIVYQRDFGLRDVEARLPVTPATRFYIGSSTKAFTAMAAAILADEGKIDLDAPLTTYWKELKLTPPLDATAVSLRDFLAMRPPMSNGTLNYRTAITGNIENEDEVLRILATYSAPVPRTFRYSNMSYEMAGHVLRKVTGKPWNEVVTEKVFTPLGMTSTTASIPPAADRALLYRSTAAGAWVHGAEKSPSTMGPAGGVYTTTSDAAKWLLAMLHDGRAGDRQLLPKRAVRLVQSPQTTQKSRYHYFDRFAWGFGQDLGDYEGELLVHRFGGFGGAYSHISFMPDRGIGVAVFSNGGSSASDAVAAYAYDLLLGKKDLGPKWDAELAKLAAAAEKARVERRAVDAKLNDRKPAGHDLAQYAGTYNSPRLGRIVITAEGQQLTANFGVVHALLTAIGGDAFLVDWLGEGEPETLRFAFAGDGRSSRIEWDDRIFERVP